MPNRGTALQYKIRRTTINNKTGDNYSITIPRIIALKFQNCFFRLEVSGNKFIFTSGCKLSANEIALNQTKKVFLGGGTIVFK